MAIVITQSQAAKVGSKEIDRLLAELEEPSAVDVPPLLTEEGKEHGRRP
jgi:hypothetical protein